MSDIYKQIISGGQITPQDKQAAMAELLRRRAGFANVAQLTGDPVLAPQGQQQAQMVQDQAQQLQRGAIAGQQQEMAQQQEARMAAGQARQLELEQSSQDLTRRGQDMSLAATLARLQQDQAEAAAKANKPPTDAQAGARAMLARMQAAEGLLGGYTPSTKDYVAASNIYGGGGALSSTIASNFMSPEGQKYYQAAADWVRAKLRKESGAAIGKEEMQQEIRTYFPLPGESKEQVEQKAQARKQAEAQLATMGGLNEAPSADVSKVIGGVKYTKRGGKWYAD